MNDDDKKMTTKAVAMRYQPERDQAPRVVAKGSGFIAEQILSTAKTHQVPILKNSVLLNALMSVELQQEIPPALYQAVAEILAYVYSLDKSVGRRRGS